jgi:hypothetical protein
MRQVIRVLFICVVSVAVSAAAYAQMPNKIKGESMAQKWEYKVLSRGRNAEYAYPNLGLVGGVKVSDWSYSEDGKEIGKLDLVVKLRELGDAGWELVSAVPMSGGTGGDFAGFTSHVIWIFKRLK